MRILRTTPTFYPHVTGPSYQAYMVSKGLAQRNIESFLVTTDVIPEDEEPGHPPDMGPEDDFPFPITRRKKVFSIDQYWVAPGVLLDEFTKSYDILHAHCYHNFIKDALYIPAKIIRDKPLIVHIHGSFGSANHDPTVSRSFQYRIYDRIFGRTVKKADAVVVSSPQEKTEAERFGIPQEKIWMIPVGKDPSVFSDDGRSPPEDKFRLLFVGRIAPRRNVELVIEALKELPENVEFRIVGGGGTVSDAARSGYFDELQQLSKEYDLMDRVTFTGPQYGDDLIEEYQSAHVFVNPTHYENFGQANLEAAFCGLPLIATETGIAPEFIESGDSGYIFSSKEDLINIVENIHNNNGILSNMSDQIAHIARENYQWNTIYDNYERLYRSVID